VFAKNGDLFAVSVATRAVTRLTQGKGEDEDPAWSPDGRRVAYVRHERGASLLVLDLATRRTRMIHRGREIADPAWSPDGRIIAFADWYLWLVARDGRRARVLLRDDNPISSPTWSPDGRRIAFAKGSRDDVDDSPSSHDLALYDVAVRNRERPTRLTSLPGWESDPDWGR
jgi:TolB protein